MGVDLLHIPPRCVVWSVPAEDQPYFIPPCRLLLMGFRAADPTGCRRVAWGLLAYLDVVVLEFLTSAKMMIYRMHVPIDLARVSCPEKLR
jgi:hypothetical protein